MRFIELTPQTIENEHICCAFSDKKCSAGYAMKKEWLAGQFEKGYVFRRLNERAKVFIEYGPAEMAWAPVSAPGYIMLGCFWVSGKYKGRGHAKTLLQGAVAEGEQSNKEGILAVVGKNKYHFMADGEWLRRQGFEEVDTTASGFSLMVLNNRTARSRPQFNESVRSGSCSSKARVAAYYTNRCPYTDYHVNTSLQESASKRGLSLEIIKIDSLTKAQIAPSPATIFSLFFDGRFITTDLSVCMDSRFDTIVGRAL
ncbi:YoaP domain-containing protein [Ottowia testudinis]|uniref:YoaP domain-containing protein n=1 Tax=Ottowia testudinis TaxID=2816950 RepID=A0A975CMX0_9BURK|nr:YoaP domain-containing protein [Ottowia testudinis]QTD47129.1 YoaP domain-containing protein [Ottowia testudinis]